MSVPVACKQGILTDVQVWYNPVLPLKYKSGGQELTFISPALAQNSNKKFDCQ